MWLVILGGSFLMAYAVARRRSCGEEEEEEEEVEVEKAAPEDTTFAPMAARKEAWLSEKVVERVCLGNGAGDLDSVVSAVVAGYLYGGVAVARFPRGDLALRRDAEAVLSHDAQTFGGTAASAALAFYGEGLAGDGSCEVVLTDHNRFDDDDVELRAFASGAKVVAVLDHHRDELRHLEAPVRDREVDPALGSCSSLLAERLLASGAVPERVAALVLSAIAVDCRGFADKFAGTKFVDRDVRAGHALLDALGARCPAGSPRDAAALRARALPERGRVLGALTVGDAAKRLLRARKDVSSLDAAQLLRLDYKQARAGDLKVGAASIMAPMSDFARRAGGASRLAAALADFADARGVDVLFAMTSAEGGAKALAHVAPRRPDLLAPLERKLEAAPAGLPADLLENPLFATQGLLTRGFEASFADLDGGGPRWSPINGNATRKTVLPAVLHCLES